MKLIIENGKANCIVRQNGTYVKTHLSEAATWKLISRGECKRTDLIPEYQLCINDTYFFKAIFEDDAPAAETEKKQANAEKKTTTAAKKSPAKKSAGRPKKSTSATAKKPTEK